MPSKENRAVSRARVRDALRIAAADERSLAIALLDAARRPLGVVIVEHCPCRPADLRRAMAIVLGGRPGDLRGLAMASHGEPLSDASQQAAWSSLTGQAAVEGVTLLDWLVLPADRSVPETLGHLPAW